MKENLNESIGMQRKAFSEKIGLTERQVLRFCELNVFNPVRPDGAPNNRRYFTETDLKIAELIHILTKLGCNPPEIKRVFEEHDHDLDLILDSAICDLKKQIAHYQNLVVAAEMTQSLGTSLFSFSDMSDSDIDVFAKAVRRSKSYKNSRSFICERSKKDIAEVAEQIYSLTKEFSILRQELDDDLDAEDFVARINNLVDEYSSIYRRISDIDSEHLLLSLGAVFAFGDGTLSSEADEIGGEGTAEFMGMCFVMTWISRMSRLVFPLVSLLVSYRESEDPVRIESAISELFSLFETDFTSLSVPASQQDEESPLDPRISLIYLVFDFANDFRDEPEFLSVFEIDINTLPTKEEFECVLNLLNEHALNNLERKEA